MSQLSKGAMAPKFELIEDALADGPVALVFYKASCPTCQFAFPYLQEIHSKGAAVKIWAISQDDVSETREFIERYGLSFEVLIDEHPYPVSSAYGVEYVPAIFIVEKDGRISMSEFGFTKASLNAIAGHEFMKPDDGIPASRPG